MGRFLGEYTCTHDLKTSPVILAGRASALGAHFYYFGQQTVAFGQEFTMVKIN